MADQQDGPTVSANGHANGALSVKELSTREIKRMRRPQRFTRLLQVGVAKTTQGRPFWNAVGAILPPDEHDGHWRQERLDTDTLERTSPTKLLQMLASMSPEMSKGLWDYQRLLNPGWTYEVFTPGTETPNARAKVLIDAFMDRLKQQHGSIDVVLGRMHMGAYMRGGYFSEIVFDEAGREAMDIVTPDPSSVRFKIVEDAATKQRRWQLGQLQEREFIPLEDAPGVSYIPVDPFPGSPYGRPLVAPALFSSLFLIGLLHDLRRVISQQGWPRIDIVVDVDKIIAGLQATGEATTTEEIETALSEAINEVERVYSQLQPDDAYVHGNEIELKGPIGAAGANLTGVEGMIDLIERMEVRGLKTMPLLLGITDGVSEANANRQWEIFVAGIKSLQHLAESMLEGHLELLCRVQGVQADVRWHFAEVRAAEAQRDALTRSQEIDNEIKLRDGGIIDQEEAANNIVGHPPAADGPIQPATTPTGVQPTDTNPEPTGNNATVGAWVRAEHPLRASHVADRAAYREHMRRQGWMYRSEPYTPRTGELRAPVSMTADGERWVLAAEYVVAGRTVRAEYDVFTPEPTYNIIS